MTARDLVGAVVASAEKHIGDSADWTVTYVGTIRTIALQIGGGYRLLNRFAAVSEMEQGRFPLDLADGFVRHAAEEWNARPNKPPRLL